MMQRSSKIQSMALISLMTAVLCVIGPIAFPVGMVPVSGTIVILYLMVYFLGTWKALASCFVYLCIGLIGLPVYSGYSGGAGVLLGPTGGYLIGYLVLILCSGFFIERFQKRYLQLIGMVAGLMGCYLLGTVWLCFVADLTIRRALLTGVVPFVLFDIFKIAAALAFGPVFRRHLQKAGFVFTKA